MDKNALKMVPGIRAAMENDSITYLNLDVKDTTPTKTAGFSDDQIAEMNEQALHAQLTQISSEEQSLLKLQTDLNQRRSTVMAILKRKAEIS